MGMPQERWFRREKGVQSNNVLLVKFYQEDLLSARFTFRRGLHSPVDKATVVRATYCYKLYYAASYLLPMIRMMKLPLWTTRIPFLCILFITRVATLLRSGNPRKNITVWLHNISMFTSAWSHCNSTALVTSTLWNKTCCGWQEPKKVWYYISMFVLYSLVYSKLFLAFSIFLLGFYCFWESYGCSSIFFQTRRPLSFLPLVANKYPNLIARE